MQTKNKIMFLLATVFLLVFTIPVYGADHKFIILSSNDPVRATQAFEAAQEALMSGNAVTLFLVRDGARLALSGIRPISGTRPAKSRCRSSAA